MIRSVPTFAALTLTLAVFALTQTAAMAQNYTGNWPITVSQSQHGNGTYCVTLIDAGNLGWPHSGTASLESSFFGMPILLEGTFRLINGLLMVTITQPGGTAENGALLFFARAKDGEVGKGVYEQFYGDVIDSGTLVFGVKNSCSPNSQ